MLRNPQLWHFYLIRIEYKMKPSQKETVLAGGECCWQLPEPKENKTHKFVLPLTGPYEVCYGGIYNLQ